MTDDELSTLEEFIDQRCKEAVAEGFELQFCCTFDEERRACCPLGAAGGSPEPYMDGLRLGLSEDDVADFVYAFDTGTGGSIMAAMGARFRERFLAGEYSGEGGG